MLSAIGTAIQCRDIRYGGLPPATDTSRSKFEIRDCGPWKHLGVEVRGSLPEANYESPSRGSLKPTTLNRKSGEGRQNVLRLEASGWVLCLERSSLRRLISIQNGQRFAPVKRAWCEDRFTCEGVHSDIRDRSCSESQR